MAQELEEMLAMMYTPTTVGIIASGEI